MKKIVQIPHSLPLSNHPAAACHPQIVAWPHADVENGLQQLSRLLRSATESNYQACEEADCRVEALIWNTQFMLEAAQDARSPRNGVR